MEMMTPERQLVSPFFLGGEVIIGLVSHQHDGPRAEDDEHARQQHPLLARDRPSRADSGPSPAGLHDGALQTYRGSFGTPFWGEGWALYWELLLWDMNFAKTPENRIGMLFWRMHRCARIIFSLSFHLENDAAGVHRFAGQPRRARAATTPRRGAPLVRRQLRAALSGAYLIGGLQQYCDAQRTGRTGQDDEPRFHDAMLKENRIPIEMVRAPLTNQKLTRDYATDWKFYGPIQADGDDG